MTLHIQWKKLLICLAVPLGVGGFSALLTRNNMDFKRSANRPCLHQGGCFLSYGQFCTFWWELRLISCWSLGNQIKLLWQYTVSSFFSTSSGRFSFLTCSYTCLHLSGWLFYGCWFLQQVFCFIKFPGCPDILCCRTYYGWLLQDICIFLFIC